MPKRWIIGASRTACWILLVLLVAIVLLSPAFETFDKWDGFPNPDKDIVLNVLAVAVSLAAAVSFALFLFQLASFCALAWELPAMPSMKLIGPYRSEAASPSTPFQALRI